MRQFSVLVFDEFIHGAGSVVYTSDKLIDMLGAVDNLAFHVVADQVTTNGSLAVRMEHSADRRNWLAKNGSDEATCTLTQGSTTTAWGAESSTAVSLAFIRLKLTMATSTVAHVKVYATGRAF